MPYTSLEQRPRSSMHIQSAEGSQKSTDHAYQNKSASENKLNNFV